MNRHKYKKALILEPGGDHNQEVPSMGILQMVQVLHQLYDNTDYEDSSFTSNWISNLFFNSVWWNTTQIYDFCMPLDFFGIKDLKKMLKSPPKLKAISKGPNKKIPKIH